MIKKELVDQIFVKDAVVKYLTSYVLYYQISLGRNVYETFHDEHLARAKLKEMNLTLEPNEVISKVLETAFESLDDSEFEKNFDTKLKQKALLHSLGDFTTNDTSLINSENYLELRKKLILEENFFDSSMKMQFLQEYPKMFEHYSKLITDEYIKELNQIILENF